MMRYTLLFLLAVSAAATAHASVERVQFMSLKPEASQLARRLSANPGLRSAPLQLQHINAWLYQAQGNHKSYPGLVLIPDCRGTRQTHYRWGERLANQGYMVLLLDVSGSGNCRQSNPGAITYHAFAALNWMSTAPNVDSVRIGVMGWHRDSVLETVVSNGPQQFFQKRFKAAIAIQPDCTSGVSAEFIAPTLILAGDKDDWSPVRPCERLVQHNRSAGFTPKLTVLPDAAHGFDDNANTPQRFLPDVPNPYREPAIGATLAYNESAAKIANKQISDFLDNQLRYRSLAIILDDLPALVDTETMRTGAWAIDPHNPGPNLPSTGHSTFDRVFSENGKHNIPWPFEALTDHLESQLNLKTSKTSKPAISKTLIPLGRSLQREAAAPNYFVYPRVVVGVDSDATVETDAGTTLLKDRLFVAYQEKAEALEVISYNEAAARFEFQIVKNYNGEEKPRVFHANRALCMSCHQNGAPIFPNAPWSETNTDREIVASLGEYHKIYSGVALREIGAAVNNLDRAANRATLMLGYQRLWSESCRHEDSLASARCTTALLTAILQQRLSEATHFDRQSKEYEKDFLPVARRNWSRTWPKGLLIPAANIPDRDPIAMYNAIPSRLDPLNRRAPDQVWKADNSRDIDRVITGLATLIPDAEIAELDRLLTIHHVNSSESTERGFCTLQRPNNRGAVFVGKIHCQSSDYALEGTVKILPDGKLSARIRELTIFSAAKFTDLMIHATGAEQRGKAYKLAIRSRRSGQQARMPDGSAVMQLNLELSEAYKPGITHLNAVATIDIGDDFQPIIGLIQRLAMSGEFHHSKPFDPIRVMHLLNNAVSGNRENLCCASKVKLPTPALEPTDLKVFSNPSQLLKTFNQFCAACHRSNNPFPPPFLAGEKNQVLQQLSECASRIRYRLSMWSLPDHERKKSTMPPSPPMENLGQYVMSAEQWTSSADLTRLRKYAAGMTFNGEDPPISDFDLATISYEDLPPCLMRRAPGNLPKISATNSL